jgi:hypothetical protein
MVAAGLYNGLSTNRGSESANDVRESAIKLIKGEINHAKTDERVDSIFVRFVLDPALISRMSSEYIGSFSYSATVPLYLYGLHNIFSIPSSYQPEAGILQKESNTIHTLSPAKPIIFQNPELYFDPHFRILAAFPEELNFSQAFGSYAHSFTDTTVINVKYGAATYRLVIGKLSQKTPGGVAYLTN